MPHDNGLKPDVGDSSHIIAMHARRLELIANTQKHIEDLTSKLEAATANNRQTHTRLKQILEQLAPMNIVDAKSVTKQLEDVVNASSTVPAKLSFPSASGKFNVGSGSTEDAHINPVSAPARRLRSGK